ncbi:uncharacterized protein LACBIDRAFT_333843 [Laccaria bicolor S238N-H82]|uniref:Predicted protein n=1 Tax=Laccaria bicolor (strain S238N-H82 / ATCC MYA-4686) TaxID=486041 RepID=B0DX94_LACBS|nr:uncharacterized protein LACBIDRAFT_333843 [Laccaria bicolor S238N-H82]EDR00796.1 predicted protein [Laccaria bicolor S238N-H82]|eukprot:XP_001888588.1 predicted protein [Laccaria bicolor S238N-H82]
MYRRDLLFRPTRSHQHRSPTSTLANGHNTRYSSPTTGSSSESDLLTIPQGENLPRVILSIDNEGFQRESRIAPRLRVGQSGRFDYVSPYLWHIFDNANEFEKVGYASNPLTLHAWLYNTFGHVGKDNTDLSGRGKSTRAFNCSPSKIALPNTTPLPSAARGIWLQNEPKNYNVLDRHHEAILYLGPEETRGICHHIFEISVMLSFMIHQEGVLYLLSFEGPEETRVSFEGPEETRVSFEGPEETRGLRVRVLEISSIFCFGDVI